MPSIFYSAAVNDVVDSYFEIFNALSEREIPNAEKVALELLPLVQKVSQQNLDIHIANICKK